MTGGAMASADEPHDDRTIAFRRAVVPTPHVDALEPAHSLLLLTDAATRRRIALPGHPVVVGRVTPATLVLEGGTVSRRHCQFSRLAGRVIVEDLGSTNGTQVNGQLIDTVVALEDGDVITVGDYKLRYHRRSAAETAETEALERDLEDASNYVGAILPPPI